jgi:hypothetical protein
VDFEKGTSAIETGDENHLVADLDAVIVTARAGELNAMFVSLLRAGQKAAKMAR